MLAEVFTCLPEGVRLRDIAAADLPFLCALYASTRMDEVNQVDWSQEQKTAFLEQQFQAQHQHYQQHFAAAEFLLIEQRTDKDGQSQWQPIGRLYLDERSDEIRLIDIALMTDHRNRGLGTNILQQLFEIAGSRDLAVRIHVEKNNPAYRLYQRLGFRMLEDKGVYDLLEWRDTRLA